MPIPFTAVHVQAIKCQLHMVLLFDLLQQQCRATLLLPPQTPHNYTTQHQHCQPNYSHFTSSNIKLWASHPLEHPTLGMFSPRQSAMAWSHHRQQSMLCCSTPHLPSTVER